MGNFGHVKMDFNNSFLTESDGCLPDDEGKYGLSAEFINLKEPYELLDYLRSLPYFGTYLGGYGGGNGSIGKFLDIDPEKGSLLIRTGSTEDDAHVGVIAIYGENGEVSFEIDGRFV